MCEKLFHDELDHLVRDDYMPPEKKLGAIEKLIGRYFEPKAVEREEEPCEEKR